MKNVTNMVAKWSLAKKHCLIAIDHNSCWECGGA